MLLGRSKDMIIRGAFNIYPALHEPVIEQIDGVRRAAMIGVFDEMRADERVVLVVEPAKAMHTHQQEEEFAQQVSTALRTTHRIDSVALPDDVVVAAIPLAGRSSKVDKAQLRQSMRQLLRDGVS